MQRHGRTVIALVGILAVCGLLIWGYNQFSRPGQNRINLGDTFTVELEENPSTGYAWTVEYDQDKLQLVKDKASPPASPVPGAPNKHMWEFRAIARGLAKIKLSYARPWESQPPQQVISYTLRIK